MAKRLILLRHAHASMESVAQTDHDRPLTDEGLHEAPQVAQKLSDRLWIPDHVLCSDAKRAFQTWDAIKRVFHSKPSFSAFPELYHASANKVLDIANAHSTPHSTLMLIGHNPGFENAASQIAKKTINLRPANAVLIEFSSEWQLIEILAP